MKRLFFVISLFLSWEVFAQNSNDHTKNALAGISQGYLEYGFKELKKSADLNDLPAQFFVGVCYERGIIVKQNNIEAFKMFRRAAERGLPDAMNRLSVYYRQGIAVAANETKSNEWLRRFQEKGGKNILPDFIRIYSEGIKHTENYALNPDNLFMEESKENFITIQNSDDDQTASIHPVVLPQGQSDPNGTESKSDVDQDIPLCVQNNDNTFAVIIANENYQDAAKVSNALNDGEIFAEYCKRTLGLPSSNIRLVKDATLNNIKREVHRLEQIAEAYQGAAKIIFYYAGHGIPDEITKTSYLLPIDGYSTDVTTGYGLDELYGILGQLTVKQIVVLLDACFSGAQRGNGMLASARGVAIKTKPMNVSGKIVVLSAAQGNETAYSYDEQQHGLFTYYLLKKLQESKGNASLLELSAYIKDNVCKKSIVANNKSQTPSIISSSDLGDAWKNWTLK